MFKFLLTQRGVATMIVIILIMVAIMFLNDYAGKDRKKLFGWANQTPA